MVTVSDPLKGVKWPPTLGDKRSLWITCYPFIVSKSASLKNVRFKNKNSSSLQCAFRIYKSTLKSWGSCHIVTSQDMRDGLLLNLNPKKNGSPDRSVIHLRCFLWNWNHPRRRFRVSPTGAGVTNLGASGFSRGSSPRQVWWKRALFRDGENVTWTKCLQLGENKGSLDITW